MQVWAYANLGYDPGALMDAVAQSSEHRMREFSPQNISNILWAYAKLGTPTMHPLVRSQTNNCGDTFQIVSLRGHCYTCEKRFLTYTLKVTAPDG